MAGLPGVLQQEVQQTLQRAQRNGNPDLAKEGNGQALAADRETWLRVLDSLGTPLWKRRWLKAERQMYDGFGRETALRGLHHYVMLWLPDRARPETHQAAMETIFDTGVTLSDLPPFLRGAYRERATYLEPVEAGLYPYLALLVAWDLQGTWDISTLHRILVLDMDVAIAMDVRHVPRAKTDWIVTHMQASLQNKLSDGKGPRDVRSERKLDAAMRVQEILDHQALHEFLLTIAVFAPTLDALEINVQRVKGEAGQRLRLEQVAGAQAELVKFFGPTPTKQIHCPIEHRRVPSKAVAVAMPFGLRKPDRTDGPLWLLQGDTPIFFNPFANKRAAHTLVVGQTGSGKTFAINVWAMRLMLQGVQVVLYEPQGHSERLVNAAGQGGARYVLSTQQQINPLDVKVTTRGESGEPPSIAQQAELVSAQLSVLLGTAIETGGDDEGSFRARAWSSIERGLLSMAMEHVYAPYDLETLTTARTPLLTELCDALSDLDEPEAKALAREIDIALVRGPNGEMFNARTSVDWNFTHDMTAYDFSEIPQGVLRVFFYGEAFGALNRYVRSKQRDRRRVLVAQIDEFGYMAKSSGGLKWFAAMAMKTWRTFGAHLWLIDQNACTYLGQEGDGATQTIFQNTPVKFIMRQDPPDAKLLEQNVKGLRPVHVDRITHQKRGEVVVVWSGDDPNSLYDEVFEGYVFANDDELRAFMGT